MKKAEKIWNWKALELLALANQLEYDLLFCIEHRSLPCFTIIRKEIECIYDNLKEMNYGVKILTKGKKVVIIGFGDMMARFPDNWQTLDWYPVNFSSIQQYIWYIETLMVDVTGMPNVGGIPVHVNFIHN